MSKTISWKCDGCGRVETTGCFPSGWWVVGYPHPTDINHLMELRHICNECEKKIPRLA